MSEFQSNSTFHLSKNPLYRSSHIVLPPSMMYGKDTLTFWCVVHGSPVPFKIFVHPDTDVDDLKKDILKQEVALRHLTYSSLVLRKLNVPEPMNPTRTLVKRIKERGDVEKFTEELTDSAQKMSTLFPKSQLPLESHVHILVDLPSDDSRSWLAIIHGKLWKEHQFFGKIFRTVTLTKNHFDELQALLDIENHERIFDYSEAKNVLAKKSKFLLDKSTPLDTDFGNGLIPRLIFDASQPSSSDVVENDDVADDDDDAMADDDDASMDIDPDHGYIDSHTDHLSNEATAIFPFTIRYVDLTVLNLQNELRVPLLMLFRNEWGTMIDVFNERDLKGMKGSAVFTGQPGIGKTCLLHSVLILCMIRGKRFVFQDVYGRIFIIDDAGVYTPEDARAVSGDVNEVLTLVDADVRCCEPNDYLLNDSKHRILLTSSPRTKKDRLWLKHIVDDEHAVWVMEPWSRQEFVVVGLFLEKNDITLKRLQQASHICGNIPRTCFKAALSPTALFDAEEEIKEAIENTSDLFDVVHNAKRGNPSHRAFQIRPSPRSRFLGSCLVQPVSAWAFTEMLNALHQKGKDKAYRFYCTIKGSPDSSQLRGRIFETYFHRYLKDSRTFVIKPLDNRIATPEIKLTVNKDSHHSFTDVKKLSEQLELSIKSQPSCYFRSESVVFPSFLYQPEIPDHDFSPLIALQVTTAARHVINIKGLQEVQSSLNLRNTFLKNLRPANNRKMIILFVVPNDLEKTFGMQEFTDKGAGVWYKKTAQYILGLPEKDLFKFHEAMVASKEWL